MRDFNEVRLLHGFLPIALDLEGGVVAATVPGSKDGGARLHALVEEGQVVSGQVDVDGVAQVGAEATRHARQPGGLPKDAVQPRAQSRECGVGAAERGIRLHQRPLDLGVLRRQRVQESLRILDQDAELLAPVALRKFGGHLVEPLDDFLEVLVAGGQGVRDRRQVVHVLGPVGDRVVGRRALAGEAAAELDHQGAQFLPGGLVQGVDHVLEVDRLRHLCLRQPRARRQRVARAGSRFQRHVFLAEQALGPDGRSRVRMDWGVGFVERDGDKRLAAVELDVLNAARLRPGDEHVASRVEPVGGIYRYGQPVLSQAARDTQGHKREHDHSDQQGRRLQTPKRFAQRRDHSIPSGPSTAPLMNCCVKGLFELWSCSFEPWSTTFPPCSRMM